MTRTIEVVFDGKAFVPTEPVDLPVGTKVRLPVPGEANGQPPAPRVQPPPPVTEEHKKLWDRLSREWEEAPPRFATLEEEMAHTRGRPWPELVEDDTPPRP
jgi:hypothetical protein